MGERLFGNRALVWCFAGIDYEMPELGSDDLVLGSGLDPWSPKAALICLDSLRLPSCTRNPHVVPRGTQIPYSPVVDLVAELGVSHEVPSLSLLLLPFFHYGLPRHCSSPTSVITDQSQEGRRRLSFVIELGFLFFRSLFF
ncbi:hypothetical protein M9H77_27906 [Catharanthus roseus]|uniref:Uncharacterized protein n=1 Tax=Catharanthus roseus TaxID=4058 RepID=A0ACC0ADV0_CATRO|nr:hypothetical protein M9H77_27906 [Catharanthus roseus]